MSIPEHQLAVKIVGDTVSAGTILGAFMGLLPAIAALGAIVWYAIQIYESRPVQTFLRLHRHKRRRQRTHRSLEGIHVHYKHHDKIEPY